MATLLANRSTNALGGVAGHRCKGCKKMSRDVNETRNAILSIKIAVNEQAERYHPNTSEFEPIIEHIDKLLEQHPEKKQVSIGGKVVHGDGLFALVFKVNGKLYAHNEENGEIIDQYLHTGDAAVLNQLSNEVPF